MYYEETFSPVEKMTVVCTLIIVSSIRQLNIYQMDVKYVFLNRDVHEDVYMSPLLGVVHQSVR